MKLKNDLIRDAIFFHAKAEFNEKGFQKAAMRSIASRSSVTLSNIYTYYKNKDDLFSAVLQPLIDKIEKGKQAFQLHLQERSDDSVVEHFDMQNVILDFIENNRSDLQLLILKSGGSKLERYLPDFKKWYSDINRYNLLLEAERNGHKNLNVSDFVMEFISSIYVDVIVKTLEIEMDRSELLEISLEIISYGHSGWSGLVNWISTR